MKVQSLSSSHRVSVGSRHQNDSDILFVDDL